VPRKDNNKAVTKRHSLSRSLLGKAVYKTFTSCASAAKKTRAAFFNAPLNLKLATQKGNQTIVL